jgi:hypothetical protein
VAGATRGAGRGIARMLGEAGASVYCTGRSSRTQPNESNHASAGRPETIEETAELVTAEGGTGIPVRVDHAVEDEVVALFERVRREQKRLDVLAIVMTGQPASWMPFLDEIPAAGRTFAEGWIWPHIVTASRSLLNTASHAPVIFPISSIITLVGGIVLCDMHQAGGSWVDWGGSGTSSAVTERRFGTAGVNSMRGPGFANVDLSVFRDFGLGGGRAVQFRMEIFNLTNTSHFANPQNSVNASNFGVISRTANSGREGIDERLFRLGLRLRF